MSRPRLIEGGIYTDHRGSLKYVNDFKFDDIKRFYIISHDDIDVVRAWHGHKYESKSFYVIKGSFQINSVQIDDWQNPSKDLKVEEFVLTEKVSNVLKVPPGFANGLKALEPNSAVVVFADASLEDSLDDDYRFNKDLWFDWSNIGG